MKTMGIVLLVFLVSVSCAGCQAVKEASPKTHLANARSLYIAAVETATELAKAGELSRAEAEEIEKVRVRVAALLEAAEKAIASGTSFEFGDLDETIATLAEILTLVATGGDE